MKKLEIGDRVRFLNTVGGGVVKGFINKQLVMEMNMGSICRYS